MKCINCGGESTGKFCMFCGSEMPENQPSVNITNNFFGSSSDSGNMSNSGGRCPKCGSSSINFKRERTGTTSRSNSRSKLFTSGRKRRTQSQTSYRTIGLCQNCGFAWDPNSSSAVGSSEKNSNLKWWVLGWIFVFPISLTILMLRNKSLNKWLRYGIIALAWIIYFAWIGSAMSNRKKKSESSESSGAVNNTISTTINETETTTSSEPTTETVIPVENVELTSNKDTLYVGESDTVTANIFPENATDALITWKSSDENVITVDDNGRVTAVGEGNATVMASSSNGKMGSCNYVVDGSKRVMHVKVYGKRDDSNNIGEDWSHTYLINDENVEMQYLVAVGDSFKCWAEYVEEDSNPDKGENSVEYKVTQEDFDNGFDIQVEVSVKENGGSNSGKAAHYIVTFSFTP